jgi:glutathione S-transferase
MHFYESNVPSGNAYKVSLLLSHLGIDHQTTTLDITATPSESRSAEFLAINPNGRIPVLVLDNGVALAESNAIMYYLASGTPFLPEDKLEITQVLQWLFFEQNTHEPYVAVYKWCKFWGGFGTRDVADMKRRGQEALGVMEAHLEGGEGRKWFVGERYTIADIALYGYTCTAECSGFEIGENVRGWMGRIEGKQGYVRLKKDPLGKCPY